MKAAMHLSVVVLSVGAVFAGSAIAEDPSSSARHPAHVTVTKNEDGWQLLRNGEPYFIKGAAMRDTWGQRLLETIRPAGANSIRTWSTMNIDKKLERAMELDVTVTVGLWLKHERHGMDYTRELPVKAQFDKMQRLVRKYKNHPSVLLWGVGNETEWHPGTNAAVYKAINDVAKMIKQEDPHHPTMTVLADLGSNDVKVAYVKKHCPDIDILGINTFGGARSIPTRLKMANWTRPYIVTEFGPLGPWEARQTRWGAPLEQLPYEKGKFYLESYRKGIEQNSKQCLGSYAFLWGQKQETTPTWFSMFMQDGQRMAPADFIQYAWTGKWPDNRAPDVGEIISRASQKAVGRGMIFTARVNAEDPDKDLLEHKWELMAESKKPKHVVIDHEPRPKSYPSAIVKTDGAEVSFKTPSQPGGYRLFVYVTDEYGNVGSANMPFYVQ